MNELTNDVKWATEFTDIIVEKIDRRRSLRPAFKLKVRGLQ
jgi:hypothetical protein